MFSNAACFDTCARKCFNSSSAVAMQLLWMTYAKFSGRNSNVACLLPRQLGVSIQEMLEIKSNVVLQREMSGV
jgi:hypothetical protein